MKTQLWLTNWYSKEIYSLNWNCVLNLGRECNNLQSMKSCWNIKNIPQTLAVLHHVQNPLCFFRDSQRSRDRSWESKAGSGRKAVALGRGLACSLSSPAPVGRHFSGSYSEEFLYLHDSKRREPIGSRRSKIFKNMNTCPKRIQKESLSMGRISE